MLKAGAVGYFLKEEAPEELLKGLEKILKGNIYLSSEVTRAALNKESDDSKTSRYNILRTKLKRPLVLDEYLSRERITEQLEKNSDKPFSLVSAGAGYGKSVAVSQWLDRTKSLYCWISMDVEQNDLKIFLTYLVEGIEEIFPGYMNETIKTISGIELPPDNDLFYIFFNELCNIESDLILVLDDYHKITEQRIHNLLENWLSFPPPSLHLCVITRKDPPLKIRSLNTSGRMTEVRMNTLSFTNEEIVRLFKKSINIDLSDRAIQLINDKTEGWILALRLATMVIKDVDDIEGVLDNFEGNMSTISDYLVSEVLSKQPENNRELMLASSILNRFCTELLDAIYSGDDDFTSMNFIEWLQKSNMFIIDLDTQRKWFRYHHLFQYLLQEKLNEKHNKEEITKYHLKASHWFEKQDFLEEAMEYALIINDYDRAAEIIITHRLDLLNNNNYYRLERLHQKIPTHIIDSDPELLLIEMYLQWHHDNFMVLGELEEKMNRVIKQMGEDSYVHIEFLFFEGYNSLFLKKDIEMALGYFEIAMEKIPETYSGPRGMLEIIFMIFSQIGGYYEKVRKMFYELIEKDLAPIRKNRIFQGFFVASIDQANLKEVETNYINAISYTRRTKMKDALGIILYISAAHLTRRNSIEDAQKFLEEALDIRYFAHSRVAIDTMSGLIIIYSLMNEKRRAEEVMTILNDYTAGLGDYFEIFHWSTKIRYCMINNDLDGVKNLLLDYKQPGVLDLVLWLDVPEITYARALIFEGSDNSLVQAEQELKKLEAITNGLHNRIHLMEVKVLQAVLFDIKGDYQRAEKALLGSSEIAEPEGIVLFFIELSSDFESLIDHMPDAIAQRPFVIKIRNQISKISERKTKKTLGEKHKKSNVLSQRELEVLSCVASGLRNQEIADKIFVSVDTVKKHIYNMFQKMNVENRLNLVTKAKVEGILQ